MLIILVFANSIFAGAIDDWRKLLVRNGLAANRQEPGTNAVKFYSDLLLSDVYRISYVQAYAKDRHTEVDFSTYNNTVNTALMTAASFTNDGVVSVLSQYYYGSNLNDAAILSNRNEQLAGIVKKLMVCIFVQLKSISSLHIIPLPIQPVVDKLLRPGGDTHDNKARNPYL